MLIEQHPALSWPRQINKIPKAVFHREDIYQAEQQRIFLGPHWHPVAHVAELSEVGSYKTLHIGEASVLVIRGSDELIRVFENACPHRGTQLATETRGTLKRVECPYHRWGFDLQGRLTGAPGMRDFPETFQKADFGMRQLRSEIVHGVVFASYSADAPPIDDYLGEAAAYLGKALGEGLALKLLGYQKVVYDTNWKEYADNEGYHAPLLHAAFRLLQWQGGEGQQFVTAYGHKFTAADLNPAPDSGFLEDGSLLQARDARTAAQSVIVALFPLAVLTRHLDVFSLRYAFPLSVDQTEVHYTYFAPADDEPEMTLHRIRQASNLLGPSGLISLEDGAVFNRLHAAVKCPGTVEFQKGVSDTSVLPTDIQQNDEAGNLIRWECYRKTMGFDRD